MLDQLNLDGLGDETADKTGQTNDDRDPQRSAPQGQPRPSRLIDGKDERARREPHQEGVESRSDDGHRLGVLLNPKPGHQTGGHEESDSCQDRSPRPARPLIVFLCVELSHDDSSGRARTFSLSLNIPYMRFMGSVVLPHDRLPC